MCGHEGVLAPHVAAAASDGVYIRVQLYMLSCPLSLTHLSNLADAVLAPCLRLVQAVREAHAHVALRLRIARIRRGAEQLQRHHHVDLDAEPILRACMHGHWSRNTYMPWMCMVLKHTSTHTCNGTR